MSERVDKITDSEETSKLFDEAREIFPDYNTTQAAEAADWICDRIHDRMVPPEKQLSSAESSELYEAVYAGLT